MFENYFSMQKQYNNSNLQADVEGSNLLHNTEDSYWLTITNFTYQSETFKIVYF